MRTLAFLAYISIMPFALYADIGKDGFECGHWKLIATDSSADTYVLYDKSEQSLTPPMYCDADRRPTPYCNSPDYTYKLSSFKVQETCRGELGEYPCWVNYMKLKTPTRTLEEKQNCSRKRFDENNNVIVHREHVHLSCRATNPQYPGCVFEGSFDLHTEREILHRHSPGQLVHITQGSGNFKVMDQKTGRLLYQSNFEPQQRGTSLSRVPVRPVDSLDLEHATIRITDSRGRRVAMSVFRRSGEGSLVVNPQFEMNNRCTHETSGRKYFFFTRVDCKVE